MRAMLRALPGNRETPTMKDQSAAQNAVWPSGKSIAVLVSILFETWSDGKGPSYFPRTTPLKPGTTDHGAIQWAQYGGNEGPGGSCARSIVTRPPPRSSAAD